MNIVVPAYHAEQTLPRCMRALCTAAERLGEEPQKVLVDDGENGDLAALTAEHGFGLVDEGPSGSAAIARNRGAARARSGIIVFVDADVAVEPDSLLRLVAPIREGVADATVGNYSEDTTGLGFLQSYKQLYISLVYARRRGRLRNQFWTAICAIRAEVFHELGGFAPSFKGACDEDTDLGFRLTRAGKTVVAVPEAKGVNLKGFSLKTLVLNDLHKGTSTLQVALQNRVSVSDNRHASGGDMLAVALASALLVAPVVGAAAGLHAWALAACWAVLAGVYLAARRDLLGIFRRHRGVGFAALAVGPMFLLDLVRAVCVPRALWGLAWGPPRELALREGKS